MLDLRLDIPAYPALWQSVLRPLRLAIVRGDLPAGTRLLEQRLAAQFGVSREPIRDALRRLEQEGLVENRQRRGAYVVGLTPRDVKEIYDLRTLLEIAAARLAAARATEEQVDHLQDLVETMADLSRRGRIDRLADPDIEFHRHLFLAADHRRLLVAWEPAAELARALLEVTTTVRHSHPRGAANHQPIVDALRAGDPDAAEQAVVTHFDHARSVMLAFVTGQLGPASAAPSEEAV
jgi:GntR family transcriptional regulator of gluconate operon